MTVEKMLKSIKPKHFIRTCRVSVHRPRVRRILFACQQIDDVTWRCGHCQRGVLFDGQKFCRVCGYRAIFNQMIDFAQLNAAYESVQRQFYAREHP